MTRPQFLRIRDSYRIILHRNASDKEVSPAQAFLGQFPRDDIVRPETTDWQYGRGTLDGASKAVTAFTPMAFYKRQAWQIAQKSPDKLESTAVGGETGNGTDVGSIRRWTKESKSPANLSMDPPIAKALPRAWC